MHLRHLRRRVGAAFRNGEYVPIRPGPETGTTNAHSVLGHGDAHIVYKHARAQLVYINRRLERDENNVAFHDTRAEIVGSCRAPRARGVCNF